GRPSVNVDEVRRILEDIAQQDRQAASVIARVRSFLKESDSVFEPLALETVVRDALALGRSLVELSGVGVQTHISAGLPRVRGDQVQLLQVVLNLLVNGCDSMSATPASDRQLHLEIIRSGDQHIELRVADRGLGLPVGGEDRIFEPFVTTKSKGLGLGL